MKYIIVSIGLIIFIIGWFTDSVYNFEQGGDDYEFLILKYFGFIIIILGICWEARKIGIKECIKKSWSLTL